MKREPAPTTSVGPQRAENDRDDLEATIDEWAKDDPEIRSKIDAAVLRRNADLVRGVPIDQRAKMEVPEACANTLGLADTSLEGADMVERNAPTPDATCINCGGDLWKSSTGWTHRDEGDSHHCGKPAVALDPQHRPSFSITFTFTDFTAGGGNIDQETFAEALFNHLCSGPDDLEEYEYSCDGWDPAR